MIDLKICGITNYKDALHAKTAGASAIGMIFYSKSPRFIDIENAKKISMNASGIKKIGIFVNENKNIINDIINELNLDAIQLHGDETPEFCNNFSVPVIKALSVSKKSDLNVINNYDVHAILLDNKIKNQFGGTGKIFNWKIIKNVKFSFSDTIGFPEMHYLFFKDIMGNIPLILEPGKINLKIFKDSLSSS